MTSDGSHAEAGAGAETRGGVVSPAEGSRLAQARVLLVDDDPGILRGLFVAFERLGVRPVTAPDGAQALARLAEVRVDLMITDIIMPEREGLETIMAARQKVPGLRIIAMSGGGRVDSGEFLRAARALGAHGVIRKPFRPSQLIALAEKVLAEEAPADSNTT